jgi:predicted XRE-type DNA-binding protein
MNTLLARSTTTSGFDIDDIFKMITISESKINDLANKNVKEFDKFKKRLVRMTD